MRPANSWLHLHRSFRFNYSTTGFAALTTILEIVDDRVGIDLPMPYDVRRPGINCRDICVAAEYRSEV
jgi:hypothetical protein